MPPKIKQPRQTLEIRPAELKAQAAERFDLSGKGDDKPLELPAAPAQEAENVAGDPPSATDAQNPWAPPPAVEIKTLSFSVPIFLPPDYPEGGAQAKRIDHVDLHLTQRQAEALRQLFAGIYRVPHLRLANGRPLYYQVDAVRWLLDQVAEQLPECAALPAAKNWE